MAVVGVPTTRTLTAGDGLTGGGTLAADRTFTVGVDNSTLEISSDALQIKDAGVTVAKLATAARERFIAGFFKSAGGNWTDLQMLPLNCGDANPGAGAYPANTDDVRYACPMPKAITVTSFRFRVTTATGIGVGENPILLLQKITTAGTVSTVLSATLTGNGAAVQFSAEATGSVAVAEGDSLYVEMDSTIAATAHNTLAWVMEYSE